MTRRAGEGGWFIVSVLLFIPLTAIFHHAIFYRPTCMLRPFGDDYYPGVVLKWLANDASPYLAVLCSVGIYWAGRSYPKLKPWALAFLISFLPLSLWIWDIPFSGRAVCAHLHDSRVGIHSRHLYALGAALWLPVRWALYSLKAGARRRPPAA
jgi:hypothetical protein